MSITPSGYVAQIVCGHMPPDHAEWNAIHGAHVVLYAVSTGTYALTPDGERDRQVTSLAPIALFRLDGEDGAPLSSENVFRIAATRVNAWICERDGMAYAAAAFLPGINLHRLSAYATRLDMDRSSVQVWDGVEVSA